MQARFEHIYASREWGAGSGEGSAKAHTRGYVRFLRRFLRREGIRSVVDLGCGDWQFSRLIDWSGIQYDGFDIVPGVVGRNGWMFSASNVRFHHFTTHWQDLPKADLLIVKDVLQHWSNGTIRDFLPTLERYPLALITNCVDPVDRPTVNEDCPTVGSARSTSACPRSACRPSRCTRSPMPVRYWSGYVSRGGRRSCF